MPVVFVTVIIKMLHARSYFDEGVGQHDHQAITSNFSVSQLRLNMAQVIVAQITNCFV